MKLDWRNPELTLGDLSEASRELLKVGSSFPFTLNAYSMTHFAPLINALVEGVSVQRIVEVGVFEAELSVYILDLCRRYGAKADLIDIAFSDVARERIEKARDGVAVNFYDCASNEALPLIDPIDLIFLDGDHNYETVTKELALIANAHGKRIVILHDVGWPCARRDIAYDPSRLISPENFKAGQLTPFSDKLLQQHGLPFSGARLCEGGAHNGVLTAVDDFRGAHKGWNYWSLPLFFGLGVMWHSTVVTPQENAHLLKLGQHYQACSELMAMAELNRLMLLIKLQDAGAVWKRQKERIAWLEQQLAERDNGT